MINKQSLWFVTLFSLMIVLGIYYFSQDQKNIAATNINSGSESYVAKTTEDESIDVLKIAEDEATIGKIDELQNILLDEEATLEEKNNAYDELEVLSNTKKEENEIKSIIEKEHNFKSFVKINDNNINVVIKSNIHNTDEANKIIRKVQDKFKENKYITVKFEG
ncbi:MAG: SpoIIIAH-like family protein [Bacilli bacterium]|nr:SpoIIIAH-like family protein [Bacilli bacterium]